MGEFEVIIPYIIMSDVYPNIKIEGQICDPTEGGLGMMDSEAMNSALSSKWEWRHLCNEESMWKRQVRWAYLKSNE